MEQLAPIEPKNARERELRDRAVRDYAALQAAQLDTGRTFFPPGTEADIARVTGRIAQKRRQFEELPLADEGLGLLVDRVLAEDRQDLPVKFGGYAYDTPDEPHLMPTIQGGYVVSKVGSAQDILHLGLTERAAQQLVSKRPVDHPAPSIDVNAWRYDVDTHDVVIRHRRLPEWRKRAYTDTTRECYAIVSPKYKAYDLDAAANDLVKVAPAGSRCRVRYDGQRATVDVILANPHYLDGGGAAGVGEAHRVVLRMKTADDGSGGYHLQLMAERVRCINLTLLHAKRSLLHGTHRQENLQALAQEALEQVEPTMAAFADTWRQAWGEYYADKYTKADISGEEALRRIVGHGKFRIPGLGAQGTIDACLDALAAEPGDTRAHVHNAMTRAVHASPTSWATRWADDTAEEQASQLLYQRVAWLPELETA